MNIQAPLERVKDLMQNEKNWVEHLATPEVLRLLAMHKDVCQQEIEFLDAQGYIDSKKAYLRKYLNKYFLYMHLRALKKVPVCKHAEKILAKME